MSAKRKTKAPAAGSKLGQSGEYLEKTIQCAVLASRRLLHVKELGVAAYIEALEEMVTAGEAARDFAKLADADGPYENARVNSKRRK